MYILGILFGNTSTIFITHLFNAHTFNILIQTVDHPVKCTIIIPLTRRNPHGSRRPPTGRGATASTGCLGSGNKI